jgi:hypothetical protein
MEQFGQRMKDRNNSSAYCDNVGSGNNDRPLPPSARPVGAPCSSRDQWTVACFSVPLNAVLDSRHYLQLRAALLSTESQASLLPRAHCPLSIVTRLFFSWCASPLISSNISFCRCWFNRCSVSLFLLLCESLSNSFNTDSSCNRDSTCSDSWLLMRTLPQFVLVPT